MSLIEDSFVKKLKYPKDEDSRKFVERLSSVLGIAHTLSAADSDQVKIASAMAAVIMYQRLNRLEKREAMRLINSLGKRKLTGVLIGKVTDVIINPRWGLWTLTNAELEEIVAFHTEVGDWSNILGANPGVYGIGATGWGLVKQFRSGAAYGAMRANVVGLIASVALMGLSMISSAQLKAASRERDLRRSYAK